MQDVRQHIDVRGRHLAEEIAPDNLGPARNAVCSQHLVCIRHGMRKVEDVPTTVRVAAEQLGHDRAVGAADVGHDLSLRQSVTVEYADPPTTRHIDHGAAQQREALRVFAQPLEEGLPATTHNAWETWNPPSIWPISVAGEAPLMSPLHSATAAGLRNTSSLDGRFSRKYPDTPPCPKTGKLGAAVA
ncbi:hypothetical protein SBI_00171 [Streptomyces bingchenggensis BCW-1]|uniref:Uncharacterized protein n=1 Tax=Streptomyces bingchenggensis (strain BCW-1) TaxID=749414 RepID=D7BUV1_STRBB|nr:MULTISPECIES: hypothetical protein [Streptomyces]ADI03292.1 hypothetical protein SBI_00171 [Streptomyces bingchenggensis BCW-1]